ASVTSQHHQHVAYVATDAAATVAAWNGSDTSNAAALAKVADTISAAVAKVTRPVVPAITKVAGAIRVFQRLQRPGPSAPHCPPWQAALAVFGHATLPASFPAVVTAALMPLWTRLAFAIGDRSCLLAAMLLFLLGTCLASAAPSLVALCAFRGLQAAGSAGIAVVCITGATYRVPNHIRVLALNGMGAAMALGTCLGQTISPKLVGSVGWRAVYIVVIPMTVIGAPIHFLLTDNNNREVSSSSPNRRSCRFDFAGTLLHMALCSMFFYMSYNLSYWNTTTAGITVLAMIPTAAAFYFLINSNNLKEILPFNLSWALLALPCGYATRTMRANHLVAFGSAILSASSALVAFSADYSAMTIVFFATVGFGAALAVQNSLVCAQAALAPVAPPLDPAAISAPPPLRALATAAVLPVSALHLGLAAVQGGLLGPMTYLVAYSGMTIDSWAVSMFWYYSSLFAAVCAAAALLAALFIPRTPFDD
ncbi:hypothetical protein HK405_012458, partial [Cladochytrium tenue]